MVFPVARASLAVLLAAAGASAQQQPGFSEAKAFTDAYGQGCHVGEKPAGGFSLDGFDSAAAVAKAHDSHMSARSTFSSNCCR